MTFESEARRIKAILLLEGMLKFHGRKMSLSRRVLFLNIKCIEQRRKA